MVDGFKGPLFDMLREAGCLASGARRCWWNFRQSGLYRQ